MFGKLKDKLKGWTEKFKKEAEESEVVEETQEEKPEEQFEPAPTKFETGTLKVEPDLEAIEKRDAEIRKEIEELKAKKKKEIEESKSLEEIEKKDTKIKKEIEEIKDERNKPPISEATTKKDYSALPPTEPKSLFSKITSKVSKIKVTEEMFDIYAKDLEMLLLENNVALDVAEKIVKRLREELVGKELLKKEIESEIYDSFKNIIEEILVEPFDLIEKIKEKQDKPYVVMFCGINGTGKTTSIAKIAEQLKKNSLSVVLAAADTFRAASIEQIKKHGEKLGIKVISQDYGTDPAAVAFDAISYAKKNRIDAVLIDTAGRMHVEKNLMKELEKVAKVANPDTKIFVGESITGNDAIEQVKSFDWAVHIDGIILSKADIDEKGGTALSLGYVTKKPILYLGTGLEYDAIEPFDKQKFIQRLGL